MVGQVRRMCNASGCLYLSIFWPQVSYQVLVLDLGTQISPTSDPLQKENDEKLGVSNSVTIMQCTEMPHKELLDQRDIQLWGWDALQGGE